MVLDNQLSYEGYTERLCPRGLVGRNRPVEAMTFDGLVQRYLIIYSVHLLLLTKRVPTAQFNRLRARCCTQHLLTHTRSGKRHVEPAIGWLCVLRSLDSLRNVCHCSGANTSFADGRVLDVRCALSLGLIRAVAGRKLHYQFLCAISLSPSLTTPMS